MKKIWFIFITCSVSFLSSAQDALTDKDYAKAENQLGYNTQKFVDRGNVIPNWLPGDKFWYRVLTPNGSEFILVDPAKGTKTAAFDHDKLAKAISAATGRSYTASMLPFQTISYSPDGRVISFNAERKQWKYDLQSGTVTSDSTDNSGMQRGQGGFRNRNLEVVSPDKTKFKAFIKKLIASKTAQIR